MTLVGGVYKRPKLKNFGSEFDPWGPRLAAPQRTSTYDAKGCRLLNKGS